MRLLRGKSVPGLRFIPVVCLPCRLIPPRALKIILRVAVIITIVSVAIVLYLRRICLLGGYPGIYGGTCWRDRAYASAEVETYDRSLPSPVPTVHFVVATTRKEWLLGQTAWLTEANLAGLLGLPADKVALKRYVADDPKAEYHPVTNKGHETSAYLTYLSTHYEKLPDVAIFMHASEFPWHTELMMLGSMSYVLQRIDMNHILKYGYTNLRVSWMSGCPDWINTTISAKDSGKKEEPLVKQAWIDNFAAKGAAHRSAPEILGVPCCNQFAVTRAAMQRNKKAQYDRSLEWLQTTPLDDTLSGRVWEHMFHYMFTGKAVECPLERKAYCSLYRICLDQDDWRTYSAAVEEDLKLRLSLISPYAVVWRPWWGWHFTRRLETLGNTIIRLRHKGLVQGKHAEALHSVGDIYAE
ncbi:hypothetical protein GGTG_04866 [Gaeumannomyces tritici R3-111a-1]|uniref:Uncharacterized protein n=1 Tax=Gaeumannomyces tritici (strain R3-111a-1) TaxID=644352 RepID=J3NUB2_GAET3|nr:hypothetical protein GGTG_04866 [Gaeumannomyces tritici R3-111a-1]EJT79783.1 hypothetical protein GGTG_04866 [Gaeumannomyces tritici R3-111a-1]